MASPDRAGHFQAPRCTVRWASRKVMMALCTYPTTAEVGSTGLSSRETEPQLVGGVIAVKSVELAGKTLRAYVKREREGRLQSAERAVPTHSWFDIAILLSA
jgi:hypothetical protein